MPSKLVIAGASIAGLAALAVSFVVGHRTGYNKAVKELGQTPAAPQKVAANA